MSLIVGEDTYITVAEADTYVSKYYPSTDPKRTKWGTLQTADKEAYLRQAAKSIDGLRLIGVRVDTTQKLEFPRRYRRGFQPDYEGTPDDVKSANVEEALEIASPTQDTANAQKLGGIVQSYTIGHLSETYKRVDDDGSIKILIKSKKAQQYLQKWIEGTYRVE